MTARLFHLAHRNLEYPASRDERSIAAAKRHGEHTQPSIFRTCEGAPTIPLPRALPALPVRFDDVLLKRKSTRAWASASISLEQFTRLVYFTWGATGYLVSEIFGRLLHKTSPSAGARHPTEVYAVVSRVDGLEPGIYHYCVRDHALERVRSGDFAERIEAICAYQDWFGSAPVVFVMTSVLARTAHKYEEDGAYRLLYIDVGHLSQTLHLVAASMGLGVCPTAAFRESPLEAELGLNGADEPALFVCACGVPAPDAAAPTELVRTQGGAIEIPDPLWPTGPVESTPQVGVEDDRAGTPSRRV
jgi:SagB-type dehydrogenase family enzyme